MNRHKSEESAI